jgi:DNA-binding transcriptional LysR family regulator
MRGTEFAELSAFAAIVEHGSFVRAAAHLGVSPSALSQTIRTLEERLGVRLLNRTTRSVAPSAEGDRLLARLAPALAEIRSAVADVHELRDRAVGTVRLNVARLAAVHVLAPLVGRFYAAYPDVTLDITVADALTDIVAGRFDAGMRLGEWLEKDMVALSVSGDLSLVAVASPEYLARHGTPKAPADLLHHRCINGRMPTSGGLYQWEFERGTKELAMSVDGPLISNEGAVNVQAAIEGVGIAYLIELDVAEALAAGRLVRILSAWSPTQHPRCQHHRADPRREARGPVRRGERPWTRTDNQDAPGEDRRVGACQQRPLDA